MTNQELELYHHGILGMKWGIRRFQNKDGSLKAAGKRRYDSGEVSKKGDSESGSGKKSSKTKSSAKSVKDMTDDELRQKINRLQMEETYSNLMARQTPQKNAKAKKFIADMADKTARTLAEKAINELGNQFAKSIKPKEKDSVTKYLFDDLTKVGDKELEKAQKRTQMMEKYLKNLDNINDPELRRGKKKKDKD